MASAAQKEEAGGYDHNFVDEVDDELKCVVCCLVLRDPIQLENCGHRLCRSCLNMMREYAQRLNTDLICPVDRELIDMQRVFQDKGISRKVGNLKTRCCLEGCAMVLDLRDLSKHEESCEFRLSHSTVGLNSESSSGASLDDILNRLQKCELDGEAKDKELLQLKFSVKELKDENVALRQELQTVKKLDNEKNNVSKNDMAEFKKKLQNEVLRLENLLKCKQTRFTDLERKVELIEVNQMKPVVSSDHIQGLKSQLEPFILENVNKVVTQRLAGVRKDIENIKADTKKAVTETRGTRSHLDKSLNNKNREIAVLQRSCEDLKEKLEKECKQHIDNIERIMFATEDLTPQVSDRNIVLKWVVQDFEKCFKLGGQVQSPIFSTKVNGHMMRLDLKFNDDLKTKIGLYLELHCNEDDPRPLPLFHSSYTLTVHGKPGYVKSRIVALDDINRFRDPGFIIKNGSTHTLGVGTNELLTAPFDDYVINNSLFITCTVNFNDE